MSRENANRRPCRPRKRNARSRGQKRRQQRLRIERGERTVVVGNCAEEEDEVEDNIVNNPGMASENVPEAAMQFIIKTEEEQVCVDVSNDGTTIHTESEQLSAPYTIKAEPEYICSDVPAYDSCTPGSAPSVNNIADEKPKLVNTLPQEDTGSCRDDVCLHRSSLGVHNVGIKEEHDAAALQGSFVCLKCCKTFPSECCFNYHRKLEHVSELENAIVPDEQLHGVERANSKFSNPSKRQHKPEESIFKCYVCSPISVHNSRTALHAHLKSNHAEQTKYECSECNACLGTRVAFNEHLSKHDPKIRPHKCRVCTLRFTSRNAKLRHENTLHPEEVMQYAEILKDEVDSSDEAKNCFRCYLCAQNMDDQKSLQKHLLDFHRQEKFYECGTCNMRIRNIVSYNRHLQRHDAIFRPFQCSMCPWRFTRDGVKRQHEADMHNISNGRSSRGHRPYEKKRTCPFCKKRVLDSKFDNHVKTQHPK